MTHRVYATSVAIHFDPDTFTRSLAHDLAHSFGGADMQSNLSEPKTWGLGEPKEFIVECDCDDNPVYEVKGIFNLTDDQVMTAARGCTVTIMF